MNVAHPDNSGIQNNPTEFDPPYPSSQGSEALSDSIARLETDLINEREKRCDERFFWVACIFLLILPYIYQAVQSFAPFIVICIFGLVALMGLAYKLGVDIAVQLIGWLLHWLTSKLGIGEK